MQHNSRTKSVIALYDASMDRALHKLSIDIWVGGVDLPRKNIFA